MWDDWERDRRYQQIIYFYFTAQIDITDKSS